MSNPHRQAPGPLFWLIALPVSASIPLAPLIIFWKSGWFSFWVGG